mgnify:FL=1
MDINLFNLEEADQIRARNGDIKIMEYEKTQRNMYGTFRRYYRWDLAKNFFTLSPKEFKEAYGFSDFYPDAQLFNKAKMFTEGLKHYNAENKK